MVKTFREHHAKVEGMMSALKNMEVPWGGSNESKVKKFVKDMDAARKKVGVPTMFSQMDAYLRATMDYAGGNVRSFLIEADNRREELGIVDKVGGHRDLMAALDKVEKTIGRPLMKNDKEGMKLFREETRALKKKHKLDVPGLEEKVKVESAKVMLDDIKVKMEEELEIIKRRDELENIDFDLANLKLGKSN